MAQPRRRFTTSARAELARDDMLTIPLCRDHHTGSRMSMHLAKAPLLRALNVASEFDLLADVLRRIA